MSKAVIFTSLKACNSCFSSKAMHPEPEHRSQITIFCLLFVAFFLILWASSYDHSSVSHLGIRTPFRHTSSKDPNGWEPSMYCKGKYRNRCKHALYIASRNLRLVFRCSKLLSSLEIHLNSKLLRSTVLHAGRRSLRKRFTLLQALTELGEIRGMKRIGMCPAITFHASSVAFPQYPQWEKNTCLC